MINPPRRSLLLGAAAAAFCGGRARAAAPIRIGVLTEMSGPYAEDSGHGSVVAARLAVEDFQRAQPGLAVDLIAGDAQTRPDVASALARSWFDRDGVDLIIEVPVSNCALAVATVQEGGDTWFMIQADYTFGAVLAAEAATTPGEQAFRPLAAGGCPFVHV